MSDEKSASIRATDADQVAGNAAGDGSKDVNGVDALVASSPTIERATTDATEGDGGGEASDNKGDSEAETIRLGEDSPEKNRNMIKTESDREDDGSPGPDAKDSKAPLSDVKSRKRKRPESNNGDDVLMTVDLPPSSPRSSVLSSPAPLARSDKDDSESTSTRRHSPHIVPASKANPEVTSRRRRLSEYTAKDDEKHKARRRPSHGSESVKDRRETRSATFFRHESHERSESPGSRARSHKRVLSTQSVQSSTGKRRKVPPPPLVTNTSQRRGRSEDRASVSSSASGSPLPQSLLRKLNSDNTAMSPMKTVAPHRKNRDQNGRTLLARACAAQELETVQARYAERPEDLNLADNAENTPLQIAALGGSAEIVKFLVEANCEIDTRNIDKDTPLIDAIENGHLEVVKILLEGGANPRLPNGKGDEPYDLVSVDDENYLAIRRLIQAAKDKDSKRRRSDDQSGNNSATFRDTSSRAASAASPRDSPPVNFPPRSPPTLVSSRRRTVRSEATRNDLLWMRPTQENLREYAGKGDMEAVGHILNVLQKPVDSESLIAAAKGGHEDVIQLLFALGDPDPDPEPLRGPNHKPGYNTPMLAAIGKGNEKVIELLLSQTGFDPTRLIYRDQTYYDIAQDRKGENWEKEYKLLKDAYNKHSGKERKSRRSDPISPRRARDRERESRRGANLVPSPNKKPLKEVKRGSISNRDLEGVSKSTNNSKEIRSEISGTSKDKAGGNITKRHRVRDSSSMEHSAIVSDQEAITPSSLLSLKNREPKARRSQSDLLLPKPDGDAVPRRRLISKKAFKSEEEKKRRASTMQSPASPSEKDAQDKTTRQEASQEKSSKSSNTQSKPSRHETSAHKQSKLDNSGDKASLKRSRSRAISPPLRSRSPSQSSLPRSRQASDEFQKKRRRVQRDADASKKPSPGEDAVMAESKGDLPSTLPEAGDAITVAKEQESSTSILAGLESKSPPSESAEKPASANEIEEEENKRAEEAARAETEANEKRQREEAEEKAREEAKAEQERLKREAERLEEERRRKMQEEEELRLREEAERTVKEEEERLARIAREEEEARLETLRKAEEEARLVREEEARQEKKRQEEELARRRAEQERLRREEQDRRRQEQERAKFLERQAAEERRRREALPKALGKSAELVDRDSQAATAKEWIQRFFPLFTATTRQLDANTTRNINDIWVPSFQVALILGIKDLQLSQFSHWEKRTATPSQKESLWRVGRRMLAEDSVFDLKNPDTAMSFQIDAETKRKFMTMGHTFWVRLSDLQDIAPRFPHLSQHGLLPLWTRKVLIDSPTPTNSHATAIGGQLGGSGSVAAPFLSSFLSNGQYPTMFSRSGGFLPNGNGGANGSTEP